jgi:hypothetical protein
MAMTVVSNASTQKARSELANNAPQSTADRFRLEFFEHVHHASRHGLRRARK